MQIGDILCLLVCMILDYFRKVNAKNLSHENVMSVEVAQLVWADFPTHLGVELVEDEDIPT